MNEPPRTPSDSEADDASFGSSGPSKSQSASTASLPTDEASPVISPVGATNQIHVADEIRDGVTDLWMPLLLFGLDELGVAWAEPDSPHGAAVIVLTLLLGVGCWRCYVRARARYDALCGRHKDASKGRYQRTPTRSSVPSAAADDDGENDSGIFDDTVASGSGRARPHHSDTEVEDGRTGGCSLQQT